MKTIAIIPARAGSKGIPNKNIRLLNDKPLICYCLENAIKSEYITEVIVTTDSKQVVSICKQYNVKVHWRTPELCLDDVTLDSVIYDVVKDREYDYVITMQPTSPTLTVDTLDSAILYAIENQLDTVISVINKPHLSWRDDNGKKSPNYLKRCNRQYLPAHYLETGAFMISRRNCVTNESRIGANIDVFEIPEREAIDIDTFADLKVAEWSLKENKVAFWVNGSNQIGLGHVSRVLELADEFFTKPDIYYGTWLTQRDVFGNTTYNLMPVSSIEELKEQFKVQKYDIIINDSLDTDADYMKSLKEETDAKVINFEDNGLGAQYADIVFNALYYHKDTDNIKSGEKYYIVPKTFLQYHPIKIKQEVKKVFICFGGADPQNYSERLLNIISSPQYDEFSFCVVFGKAKKNAKELMQLNNKKNIDMYFDVENMPELMSDCDVAVTSRGRTGYELAVLGIPTIAMAQNQREELHQFVSRENGFIYLGLNPSDYVIESNLKMFMNMDQKGRLEFQSKLLSHDLKKGRKRIMNLIDSL